jgi:chromosome segregation ATPase
MSSSHYRTQVVQLERMLNGLRSRDTQAKKKVAALQKDITRLTKQANGARSESLRRNYLRQMESKESDLGRARDAEVKLAGDVSGTETKLGEAKRKLAEDAAREERRDQQKQERERRPREQQKKLAEQKRKREEQRAEREQAAREAQHAAREVAQEREIGKLAARATELELKLAEAERRAAPPEITVLFLASSPEDQPQLRLDRETREIQKRVRASDYRESIWFELRMARQLPDLLQDLNELKPHVVHFSGHGDQDTLAFEDENGNTTELTNEQLGRLLAVSGNRIRLAIFNSCKLRGSGADGP